MAKDNFWIGVAAGLVVAIPLGLVIAWCLRSWSPASSEPLTTYLNEEDWSIVQDEEGRVTGVKAHRRAQET